ncbi:unnamed protein product [Paramecium octaurelia]|uniref:PPM-type phosphatase domain-containing protein n=1 Tax=Paramecium octaurelia TaxID=43137 RepID=A0A8S1W772_PAROT|nr:unnamed protein product [Paramecium octaurelia]
MKQKAPQISPNKLYASLLKKKNESDQQQKIVKSPVIQGNVYINSLRNNQGQLKVDAKKSRPTSGKDLKDISTVLLKKTHARQNSKIIETKENSQNLTQSALQLLQKIKAERPDNKIGQIQTSKEILQYHQQLIQKQYQKLLDLSKQTEHNQLQQQQQQQQQQQKQKLFKGPRSISNPDISTLQLCITKAHAKSIPGMLYTGQTKINQDSYKLIQKFGTKENDWYLQVSDGHGTNGHQVAQFVQEILPAYIEQEVMEAPYYYDRDKTINNIFKQSFLKTNEDLLNSGIDVTYSGATTVVVIAFENILYCANIGDSRAIIGRYDTKLQVVELSKDHKPDCFLEQARIIQRGGRVQAYSDEDGNPIGPARVWKLDEDVPGLAMSRSFGDYVASQVGVICEPEIIKHQLLPSDKFLVVASDGIWEFLSNEWVIETVNEYYKKGDAIGACNKLTQAAKEAWQREDEVIDDITVILAFFK